MATCTPPPSYPWCEPSQFDSRQCWRCMSPAAPYEDEYGQDGADIHGNTVGCKPCQDIPTFWFNHFAVPDGVRFLGRSYTGFERDALGRVGDVMSWHPIRVLHRLDLIRAACYRYQDDKHYECYGLSSCDCPRKVNPPTTGSDNTCKVPGFPPVEHKARMVGMFPDCFAYHQPLDDAQITNTRMFIRDVLDPGSDMVRVGNDVPWHNTVVHTFGDRDLTPCTINQIATCTSEVFSSSPCGGALANNTDWWIQGAGGERIPPDTYLYDTNASVRHFFDAAFIQSCTARFNTRSTNRWLDHTVLKAKNKVLHHVLRDVGRDPGFRDSQDRFQKFDTIRTEHYRVYANAWHDTSQRPADQLVFTEQYVPDVFGRCALHTNRFINLTGFFVVTGVDISADIVILKQRRTDYAGKPHQQYPTVDQVYALYPHVGLFIRIIGVPVVVAIDELPPGWRIVNCPAVVGDWQSGQRRDMSPDGMPVVLDNDGHEVDRIVYRDPDGQVVTPFFEVTWRGMLNDFSRPRTYNLLEPGRWVNRTWSFNPLNQGVAHGCGATAEAFDNVFVPGYPVHEQSDANDPAQLYHGGVTLTFRHGPFYSGG